MGGAERVEPKTVSGRGMTGRSQEGRGSWKGAVRWGEGPESRRGGGKLETEWGGSAKMAASEEEPKTKKLKVEATPALRWAQPYVGWRVTAPAANQGPRVIARPLRWVVSQLPAWGQRAEPAAPGAVRMAATSPAQFGGVDSRYRSGSSRLWPIRAPGGVAQPAEGWLRAPRGSPHLLGW